MARARNIKPGFFKNDRLAECCPLARLLFAGLWCEADRAGRLEDRPKRLKAEYLPYDDCDVEALLNDLASRGFILRYEASGERYIAVPAFAKHQNPHVREPASSIPPPDQHSASTVQAPDEHGTGPALCSSPFPDSPSQLKETASPAEEPAADPIWGTGLDFLKRKGLREPPARAFLGLLRKELHDDLTVAELLGEAERQDVSNPQAWLSAAAKARKRQAQPRAGPTGFTSQRGQAIEMIERMKRGLNQPDLDPDATVVVSRA